MRPAQEKARPQVAAGAIDLPLQLQQLAYVAAQECTESIRNIIQKALQEPPVGHATTPLRVILCTTVLKRAWQARWALPINIANVWRYRRIVVWHVGIFTDSVGEGDALLEWAQESLAPALECGLVRLHRCTGLAHWDASRAKNTIHKAAVREHLGERPLPPQRLRDAGGGLFLLQSAWFAALHNLVLVNLDGDNILGQRFVPQLLELIHPASSNDVRPDFVRFKGNAAGVTGRLACRASLFVGLNGYDEGMPYPSGYQDIDLCNRARRTQVAVWGQSNVRSIKAVEGSGSAIPNDLDNVRVALGAAKVVNCSDAARALTWGAMNGKNMQYAKGQTDAVRNRGKEFFQLGVEATRLWPFASAGLPSTPAPAAQPSSARPPAPAAPQVVVGGWTPPPPARPPSTPAPPPARPPSTPAPAVPPVVVGGWTPPSPAAAPTPAEQRPCYPPIDLYTVGVELLHLLRGSGARNEELRDVLSRRRATLRDDLLLAAMAEVELTMQAPAVIVVDCRCFDDPDGPRGLRNHVGTHPTIMQRLQRHANFGEWIARVRRDLAVALGGHGREGIEMVFFCRKGRHRSVACAKLMQHCLGRLTHVAPPIEHLSRGFWHRGTCDECRTCCKPCAARDEVYAAAWAAFREAGRGS